MLLGSVTVLLGSVTVFRVLSECVTYAGAAARRSCVFLFALRRPAAPRQLVSGGAVLFISQSVSQSSQSVK